MSEGMKVELTGYRKIALEAFVIISTLIFAAILGNALGIPTSVSAAILGTALGWGLHSLVQSHGDAKLVEKTVAMEQALRDVEASSAVVTEAKKNI